MPPNAAKDGTSKTGPYEAQNEQMLCLTLANSGNEHLIGQEFAVLGLQLSALTTGRLFFYESSSQLWGSWA